MQNVIVSDSRMCLLDELNSIAILGYFYIKSKKTSNFICKTIFLRINSEMEPLKTKVG